MGLIERLLPPREPQRWARPQAVLPGPVGMDLMLAHTDAAAITTQRPIDKGGRPLLVENGGLADQRRFDLSFWVWRLPPPGPVTFTCVADGTTTTNLEQPPFDQPNTEPAPGQKSMGAVLADPSGCGVGSPVMFSDVGAFRAARSIQTSIAAASQLAAAEKPITPKASSA